MKRIFKFFFVVLATLIALVLINNQCSNSKEKELEKAFWDENPGIKDKPFEELTIEEKEIFLKQFIAGGFKPFSTWNYKVQLDLEKGLKGIVKYPETMKFRSPLGWGAFSGIVGNSTIENADKGILVTLGEFKAQNKLGMEVRSTYSIKYKFDGKNFEVVDINIE